MKIIKTESEIETELAGKNFAKNLEHCDLVLLNGELASGKTAFTRGICENFSCADQVSSPTFTIVNQYVGELIIFHSDLYRLDTCDSEKIREIYDLASRDEGILIIEWGQRLSSALPDHYQIEFQINKSNPDCRQIKIQKVFAS